MIAGLRVGVSWVGVHLRAVATVGAERVGLAELRPVDGPALETARRAGTAAGRTPYRAVIRVEPRWRRKGVGLALYAAAVREIASRDGALFSEAALGGATGPASLGVWRRLEGAGLGVRVDGLPDAPIGVWKEAG